MTTKWTITDNGFWRRDRCPCCGADVSLSRNKVASVPPAETLSFDAHSAFASRYASTRVFFTYAECTKCSVLYCPIYYRQEDLSRLYARQDENMGDASLEARQRTQKAYARILGEFSRMSGNFLEIGADIGLFAAALARSGGFDGFLLYEPNLEVHEQLTKRLDGWNADIRARQFRPDDLPACAVSTAAMIHVLDHLIDPTAVLKGVREALEPNGILLIVVHDVRSLLAALLRSRWPAFCLQHPQLFSRRSIVQLLKSAGLECVRIDKTTNFFPATHFLKAACSISGLSPDWIPAWNRPMVGMRLGNIAVVARKA